MEDKELRERARNVRRQDGSGKGCRGWLDWRKARVDVERVNLVSLNMASSYTLGSFQGNEPKARNAYSRNSGGKNW